MSTTEEVSVSGIARDLRARAELFESYGDTWTYSRDLGELRAIRYDRPEDRFRARFMRALRFVFLRNREWDEMWQGREAESFRFRLSGAWWMLTHRELNLPDGVLNNGNVIAFWEETGEFLSLMSPSVALLLSDWLQADPTSPHAFAISMELHANALKLSRS